MKKILYPWRLIFVALSSILLTGCLLRTATVPPRHFVLAPIPADEQSTSFNDHLSVEIGFVKMPAYLLRDHLAIRTDANEIEYLENALWAERLDQSFQRTLTVNLTQLLSSDGTRLTEFGRRQPAAKVFVTVQQFDVDTHGHGVLIAQWRISTPDSDAPLKSGDARLTRTGASPRGDPYVIATTLSSLTDDFSRDMTQSIRDYVKFSR